MSLTQRPVRPEDFLAALTAVGADTPGGVFSIRAIFTRQPLGEWTFHNALCVLGEEGPDEPPAEIYRQFAFAQKQVRAPLTGIFESLATNGICMAEGLPALRFALQPLGWTEEIVPSHATRSGRPARRLMASVTTGSFFPESRLIDFHLPYRASAARYAREFLGLAASDSIEGRGGQFTIEVPDERGAIQFAEGSLSIRDSTVPLRLVGTINGDVPIDIGADEAVSYDASTVREVELWLLTQDHEVVDYVSGTEWPHKYQLPELAADREHQLLEFIGKGESEVCEFKPFIALESGKASEVEKTVCAFSNQRGGMLFIGVTDEGDVVGLARELARRPEDIEKATGDYETQVRTRLRETLKDNQCFSSTVAVISGTRVILVEVSRSQDINYFVKSDLAQMAYIRHGATNMKLSPPEMKARIEAAPRSMFQGLNLPFLRSDSQ